MKKQQINKACVSIGICLMYAIVGSNSDYWTSKAHATTCSSEPTNGLSWDCLTAVSDETKITLPTNSTNYNGCAVSAYHWVYEIRPLPKVGGSGWNWTGDKQCKTTFICTGQGTNTGTSVNVETWSTVTNSSNVWHERTFVIDCQPASS